MKNIWPKSGATGSASVSFFEETGGLRPPLANAGRGLIAIAMLIGFSSTGFAQEEKQVSFYRDVRPIVQRRCSGCHQPAKAGGKLVLTNHSEMAKGGENGPGIVPGKPEESTLVEYISGDPPQMPLKDKPLTPAQVGLISKWISQGAIDDTPEGLVDTISADNPPQYTTPPVITAIAYSPDSLHLAVSGYREVLIHSADGEKLEKRLVGRSQRIDSLSYSPDGKLIAAVGGTPSLFGELQFWKTEDYTLARSATFATDLLFGVRFSEDSKLVSFGGADNSIRIVKTEDATLSLKLDPHSDYVFGTTFSLDGKHVVSVSRDMAMKLCIVENGQFVDNITSITPGALKGGLMAVRRHPKKDDLLIGGADGEPKLYQMFRTQARVIGDDFNRIRSYPTMPGRIYSLDFNSEGSLFVAGSSTALGGSARIYNTEDGKMLHELAGHSKGVFSVAFRPDGKQVATAGFDGRVRLFDVASGSLVKEFVPVPISPEVATK